MFKLKSKDYKIYSKFLSNLAIKLNGYYYSKLKKPIRVQNKMKGRGYDPVTPADKAFEKYIIKQFNNDLCNLKAALEAPPLESKVDTISDFIEIF